MTDATSTAGDPMATLTKAPGAVNGPYSGIPFDPAASTQLDWEVELGVIIGRRGKNIREEDAFQHVFGYTIVNDVSARDLQARHQQFFKGKSLDTFCPMGPVVVTADGNTAAALATLCRASACGSVYCT